MIAWQYDQHSITMTSYFGPKCIPFWAKMHPVLGQNAPRFGPKRKRKAIILTFKGRAFNLLYHISSRMTTKCMDLFYVCPHHRMVSDIHKGFGFAAWLVQEVPTTIYSSGTANWTPYFKKLSTYSVHSMFHRKNLVFRKYIVTFAVIESNKFD